MFSKLYTYEPVGLFSTTHLISIVVLFFVIMLLVISTKKMTKKQYSIMLKVFAVVFTCLELFKIIWTFCQGNYNPDAWVPMYFCSLFIYALWITYFKNKRIKEFGLSFIGLGGIVGGIAFIIFPTTSFRWYPIFHFQCIYSMIYHTAMVYAGIMCFVTKSIKVNVKTIFKYCIFTLVFMLLATGMNFLLNTNFMFTSYPGGIPLKFLHSLRSYSRLLYILLMIFSHTILIGFGLSGIVKLIEIIYKKKTKNKKR